MIQVGCHIIFGAKIITPGHFIDLSQHKQSLNYRQRWIVIKPDEQVRYCQSARVSDIALLSPFGSTNVDFIVTLSLRPALGFREKL